MSQKYQLDQIILIKAKENMNQPGKVRFYGEVAGTNGIWYGIELFEPNGRHNGFVKGQQYFTCKENYGIFLREKSLAVYEGDPPLPANIEETKEPEKKKEEIKEIKQIVENNQSNEYYISIIEKLNGRVIELEQNLQDYRSKSTKFERNQENSTEVLENYRKQIFDLELQNKKQSEKLRQLEQINDDQSANQKLIEQLTLKNEDLSITNELQMYELDDANTQIQQLKEELQQFAIQINNTVESKGEDIVISENATMDQLATDNQKLKYALQLLNEKYLSQKEEHERQTETFSLALAKVPELQSKLQHMEAIELELKEKESENEELKAQIDQNSEATMMIELMSTEIMKKDQEIVELKRSIKDFKEEQYVDAQLIDEYDAQLKETQGIIIQKDFQISQKEANLEELKQKLELEAKLFEKIKEKLESTTTQLNYLQEMQNDSSNEKEQLQKIDQLFFKQYEVNEEKRELAKQLIAYSVQNIELKNESMITELYFKTLPKELLTSLQLDQFRRYLTIKEIHQKCIFIFKQLVSQYLEKKSLIKDQFELIQWAFKFLTQIITLYSNSLILDNLFINSDLDQYSKLCRSDMYTAIVGANSYLANIINHMKEDALSAELSQELLERINQKLVDALQPYQEKLDQDFLKQIMFQKNLMKIEIFSSGIYLTLIKIDNEREVFLNCFQKFKLTLDKILNLCIRLFFIFQIFRIQ